MVQTNPIIYESDLRLVYLEAIVTAARAVRAGAVMQSLLPGFFVSTELMFTLSDALDELDNNLTNK